MFCVSTLSVANKHLIALIIHKQINIRQIVILLMECRFLSDGWVNLTAGMAVASICIKFLFKVTLIKFRTCSKMLLIKLRLIMLLTNFIWTLCRKCYLLLCVVKNSANSLIQVIKNVMSTSFHETFVNYHFLYKWIKFTKMIIKCKYPMVVVAYIMLG